MAATQVIGPGALEIPEALAQAVREARRVVAFTGAGVSAESGIPTFRGARIGPCAAAPPERPAGFDPMRFASPEGFAADPRQVWEWYEWRRGLVRQAEPNPAHLALARLEDCAPAFTLITQNVDDLHERAGSRRVLHLHGKLFENRCSREGRLLHDWELDHSSVPPRCPCGAYARPGVVWFGEPLPARVWEAAAAAVSACDLCLVVGTSAVVRPAADLVDLASPAATRVVVNPEVTDHAEGAHYFLQHPAGRAVPALVEAAFGREGQG